MFERILKRMREQVRARQYVMTLHCEEEMSDDDLSIFDVESAILTGKIIERQKEQATAEWKYLVQGQNIESAQMIVAAKLSPTGKLVFITVYRE